jgi:lipid-A-disaccharide synthase
MTADALPIRLAIIVGESSGDHLGADLVSALKLQTDRSVELIGVGGPALAEEGLVSLFDYGELSIIGYGDAVKNLPRLIRRIRQTTEAIVASTPDMLIIIDSPDFTHRVAKAVRKKRPGIRVIDYVCPTVWAWKPERAKAMNTYVDHVLSIFPFEADVVERLSGPPLTYVGHRLATDPALLAIAAAQRKRRENDVVAPEPAKTCLLLPGSRSSEVRSLMPDLRQVAELLKDRVEHVRFVIPTLDRLQEEIERTVAGWPVQVEVTANRERKNEAWMDADAAVAASGTVLLELALAGIPVVSIYRIDRVSKLFIGKVTAWTAALPNFIADYPVINEYINESLRPGLVARRLQRLLSDSYERRQILEDFDTVRDAMHTSRPSGVLAAEVVLNLLEHG